MDHKNETARTSGHKWDRSDWMMIAAIVLVAMALRPGIVSTGPVLPVLIDDFGLSHTIASLMTAIPEILMGTLALPTPWLLRKFGVNPVLFSALSVLGLSVLARAFAPSVAVLLMATVGIGAGIAVAGTLFAGVVKSRFASHVALVMGIYATAISLGSSLAAGLTGWLSQSGGGSWRLPTGVWAISSVIAIMAWIVARHVMARDGKSAPIRAALPGETRLPVNNRVAWLIAVYFAAVNLLFYSLLTWIAPMYQEHGYSTAQGGLILAVFMVVFTCASPLVGALSKSTDRRKWLAGCAMLVVLGLLGIVLADGQLPFVWIPVTAFGLGGAFTLAMTLPLDNTHSAHAANSWNAFVLTFGYLVAAIGPLVTGTIRDVTGNFTAPFVVLIGCGAVMLVTSAFLKPREIPVGPAVLKTA